MRSVLTALAFVACAAVVQAQPFATKDLSTTTCPGAGCLILQVDGQGSIGIQVTGTFVGTLQFKQSIDATIANFVSLSMIPSAGGAAATSATAPGLWTGPIAGARYVLVMFSAYTSGTATVSNATASAKVLGPTTTLSTGLFADGSAGAPSVAFASDSDTGIYRIGSGDFVFANNGTPFTRFTGGELRNASTQCVSWAAGDASSSADLFTCRDAANTLALRNGTNAQGFNVYNTFTDASNYERLAVGFSSNVAVIGPSAAGTGSNRSLRFQVNGAVPTILFNIAGTDVWNISNAGNFVGITQTRGLGYGTGAGGAVTQLTSRATGVTLNTVSGDITLFSAAGSATAASFTVTNSAVAANDNIIINQKSGTNLYQAIVTTVGAGSFVVTFFTTGGTAVDAPVFHFSVIKGANS